MAREIEVKIVAARDLKNVNWRHGPNKPYAVVWVDPKYKSSTVVDPDGDTWANWDETLVIPVPAGPAGPIDDFTLCIDIVHAGHEEDTKKLIGSARLRLSDASFGERSTPSLQLKRSSGRPHGKLDVNVFLRESRYRAPDPYYASPYGVPPSGKYDAPNPYNASSAHGGPYGGAAARDPYYTAAAPPSGYPYSSAPIKPQPSYGQSPYGYGKSQTAYGQRGQSLYGKVPEDKKKNKFGMGAGLAVGAVAGLLGGLALVEGAEYVEDQIAEKAAEKVEEDLGYGDDDEC